MTLILSVFEQGMIYAVMALGVYITYKILDFPDLTVDGGSPLQELPSEPLIARDVNPVLAIFAALPQELSSESSQV